MRVCTGYPESFFTFLELLFREGRLGLCRNIKQSSRTSALLASKITATRGFHPTEPEPTLRGHETFHLPVPLAQPLKSYRNDSATFEETFLFQVKEKGKKSFPSLAQKLQHLHDEVKLIFCVSEFLDGFSIVNKFSLFLVDFLHLVGKVFLFSPVVIFSVGLKGITFA